MSFKPAGGVLAGRDERFSCPDTWSSTAVVWSLAVLLAALGLYTSWALRSTRDTDRRIAATAGEWRFRKDLVLDDGLEAGPRALAQERAMTEAQKIRVAVNGYGGPAPTSP